MNEFSKYHPVVNFVYFVAVLGFSCVFMHPVTLLISLLSGFIYSVMLNGKKAIIFNSLYMLPILVITALINPVFNHEGITILCHFPNGKPITLEAVLYGVSASTMIWSVICHFSCFNKIMTSDKIVYLCGKVAPSLSIVLSMILRFIPKFKQQIKTISNAQMCVGKDISNGSIIKRAKNGIKILSSMVTWSLENSIDTADSMKSRGYGLKNRTKYSNFKLSKRDIKALLYIAVLSVCIISLGVLNMFSFEYFPSISGKSDISVFAVYLLLFICPIIIEVWEAVKWKKLRSKI